MAVSPRPRQCGKHLRHKTGLVELPGTHVDRQAQRGQVGLLGPRGQAAAGRLQHPFAQRQDQAGFFGQRDEMRGRDEAVARVPPAQQGLGADDAAVVDLGLVVQLELALGQAHAHVQLQRSAGADHGLHLGVIKAQGVAPRVLGLVQGKVGALEEFIHRLACAAVNGDAHAQRAVVRVAVDLVRLAQHAQDALAHVFGTCSGLCGAVAQVFQHHHKFVAALACYGVVLVHTTAQAVRHLQQQGIAPVVAAGFVHRLEVVQVQHQQGAAAVVARAGGQRLLQPVHQQAAVGQAGERVVVGQLVDLFLGSLALAQVLHGDQAPAFDKKAGDLHRLVFAVSAANGVFGQRDDALV